MALMTAIELDDVAVKLATMSGRSYVRCRAAVQRAFNASVGVETETERINRLVARTPFDVETLRTAFRVADEVERKKRERASQA